MSQQPLARSELVFLGIFFGAVFVYCLYGTLSGDLYIPSKNGNSGAHLRGWPAWSLTVAPLAFYLAIRVRHSRLYLSRGMKNVVELSLLAAGIVLMAVSVQQC